MASVQDILDELKPLASESYARILKSHGVRDPVLGVKVEYLKQIQKRIKTDYQLANDLFATGVYDAQYLAGLIADDARMTRRDLTRWLKTANSHVLCGFAVAWVAAGSPHGHDLALEWIDAKNPDTAATGWATLGGIVAVTDDADLDVPGLKRLLDRVGKTIHRQPDRVRYAMNNFVIAAGAYVRPLTAHAVSVAKRVGKVEVDMGDTACKVPDAAAYIDKVKGRGAIGRKRKTVKC
jgi:3-methyladenine DNA glycosylase AlkD